MRRIILAAIGLALLGCSPAFAGNAYVCELSDMASTVRGAAQVAVLPCIVDQKVAFSGTPGSTAAFNTLTKFIRVHCDSACSILIGGTASTANMRIPLDGVEYFGAASGAVLSVIANP